ncbi:MAG: pyridine nucleotide-disulfide oxidoreductase [Deltaproteobacteria bacterium HGW-Deltaproteobacteria-14]|jgi:NADPH-dependent 2,4-dienoyl-CoA reductase/sulfur reductase-like enzyme|nr:MAG: pyridine nucleotide-disulfide oxidoreductase [Deltaproteobacteria bacterium HGW-Deltaproteobacteria-14]
MADTTLIIGAGQTAAEAVATLREVGYPGRIVLVGAEPHLPYARTPLSGEVLAGAVIPEDCAVHDAAFYRDRDVTLELGRQVLAVDRAARTVRLDDGRQLAWDQLLIATGAHARRLAVPGADLVGVSPLRTLDEALLLRDQLATARRVVVVGGGWIGLQATATAHAAGCDVTLVEAAEHLLARVAAPEVACVVRVFHATRGVHIICDSSVSGFEGAAGRLTAVLTHDDRRLPADVAIVAIGATPNGELAAAAGLEVADGVLVDASGRTNDPHIFAAGDCTRFFSPPLGRTVRLESWRNARRQARVVARAMAGDADARFDEIPFVHSDQGDLHIDVIGAPVRWNQVMMRGSPWIPDCTALMLEAGVVVGAATFNRPQDNAPAEALIRAHATPDPRALLDREVPLASLVP